MVERSVRAEQIEVDRDTSNAGRNINVNGGNVVRIARPRQDRFVRRGFEWRPPARRGPSLARVRLESISDTRAQEGLAARAAPRAQTRCGAPPAFSSTTSVIAACGPRCARSGAGRSVSATSRNPVKRSVHRRMIAGPDREIGRGRISGSRSLGLTGHAPDVHDRVASPRPPGL